MASAAILAAIAALAIGLAPALRALRAARAPSMTVDRDTSTGGAPVEHRGVALRVERWTEARHRERYEIESTHGVVAFSAPPGIRVRRGDEYSLGLDGDFRPQVVVNHSTGVRWLVPLDTPGEPAAFSGLAAALVTSAAGAAILLGLVAMLMNRAAVELLGLVPRLPSELPGLGSVELPDVDLSFLVASETRALSLTGRLAATAALVSAAVAVLAAVALRRGLRPGPIPHPHVAVRPRHDPTWTLLVPPGAPSVQEPSTSRRK